MSCLTWEPSFAFRLPTRSRQQVDPAITITAVERLEQLTDEAVGRLQPLGSFILPGGTPFAAALHLARTVCRRAERDVLSLAETESVSRPVRTYLNRLSDLLFVWARVANDDGRQDVLWQPGSSDDRPSGK